VEAGVSGAAASLTKESAAEVIARWSEKMIPIEAACLDVGKEFLVLTIVLHWEMA
jgi:hypothetical protein